jgi:hypothetical protein
MAGTRQGFKSKTVRLIGRGRPEVPQRTGPPQGANTYFNWQFQSAISVFINRPGLGEKAMDIGNKATLALALLAVMLFGGNAVKALTIQRSVWDIALKSGETTELGDVYWIASNCKSLLKGTPAVEILDGPPGVTVAINAAKVVPHFYSCSNPVAGGKLLLTASDIQDYSYTRLVLRITYKTVDGERQRSENFNIALFPPS